MQDGSDKLLAEAEELREETVTQPIAETAPAHLSMGAVVAVAFAIACFVGARKNQSRPAAWLGAALVFVALVLAIVALRTYF